MITTDPNDPNLKRIRQDGQQESYLVLSDEERAKGFVRPYRDRYEHVGARPQFPLRELTDDERAWFKDIGYVRYEAYPPNPESSVCGRYWTKAQLESGCGTVTTMGRSLSETYAREPKFYGATFCCGCGKHFPVAEFVWEPDGSVVGS